MFLHMPLSVNHIARSVKTGGTFRGRSAWEEINGPSLDSDHYANARHFLGELLRSGLVMLDLFDNLLDGLSDDAFPGEDPAEVLLEMIAGTITPAIDAAGEDTVRAAVALLGAVCDRTVSDLRAAADLAGDA